MCKRNLEPALLEAPSWIESTYLKARAPQTISLTTPTVCIYGRQVGNTTVLLVSLFFSNMRVLRDSPCHVRAVLRSQAGAGTSVVLEAPLVCADIAAPLEQFNAAFRRRLG